MRHLRILVLICFTMMSALLSGCSGGKVEVLLDAEYSNSDMSEEEKEYWAVVYGEEAVTERKDLSAEIYERTEVEIIGSYKKDSEFVEVRVVAPDVYKYVMDNSETLMELDEETLYENILGYINNPSSPKREEKLKLSAEYMNDTLVVDTETFAYQDAVSGGWHSAMTDIYIEIIKGMGDWNE